MPDMVVDPVRVEVGRDTQTIVTPYVDIVPTKGDDEWRPVGDRSGVRTEPHTAPRRDPYPCRSRAWRPHPRTPKRAAPPR